ncbi:NUDIX hydrolase [Gandjariella thermophila]|uniref:Coenzyme A pyrophosphatase n=1 Tax=Gandjariella thermophila TaxID=1931992 RepID=A0A4D4J275_9PSEU|nr:CoA pyrophosphatase [Gandjariella thermophila]GDY30725.1 coenzyme A pyrophosphatase [Gandjariella thermophila]
MSSGPLAAPDDVPEWLSGLVRLSGELDARTFTRFAPPRADRIRPASVLVLLGEDGAGPGSGPDVLLLRRADTLPSHPGQVAFPGGAAERGDAGPVATALREAEEEVGVRPDGVRPVALLPELYIPVSGFLVTPVLAHWREPCPVHPVDPAETSAVARVPIADLANPANRFRVRHTSGYYGPAFALPGMLVWGFTAGLLTELLSLAGWERPWDDTDLRDLDAAWRAAEEMGRRQSRDGDTTGPGAGADSPSDSEVRRELG